MFSEPRSNTVNLHFSMEILILENGLKDASRTVDLLVLCAKEESGIIPRLAMEQLAE